MRRRRASGFTYLVLLIAVALMGAALAGAGTLWSTDARRAKEAELLFAGEQIRQAIQAYYETVPAGQPNKFPARLEDLVEDRRWPKPRRHLRRIYLDPLTESRDWAIVKGPGDGILGVHSRAQGVPIKHAGFPKDLESFAGAKSYAEWKFVYQPRQASGSPAAPPPGATSMTPAQLPQFGAPAGAVPGTSSQAPGTSSAVMGRPADASGE
jgi:type II secretory pathway pseudopilin PulG